LKEKVLVNKDQILYRIVEFGGGSNQTSSSRVLDFLTAELKPVFDDPYRKAIERLTIQDFSQIQIAEEAADFHQRNLNIFHNIVREALKLVSHLLEALSSLDWIFQDFVFL